MPEDKVVKNRLHLGCTAGDLAACPDAEVARLLDLGATIAWEEDFPPEIAARYRNIVLSATLKARLASAPAPSEAAFSRTSGRRRRV